jgi:hypothetical protein
LEIDFTNKYSLQLLKSTFLLCIFAQGRSRWAGNVADKIVGGINAAYGEFPWQVSHSPEFYWQMSHWIEFSWQMSHRLDFSWQMSHRLEFSWQMSHVFLADER